MPAGLSFRFKHRMIVITASVYGARATHRGCWNKRFAEVAWWKALNSPGTWGRGMTVDPIVQMKKLRLGGGEGIGLKPYDKN